MRRHIILMPVLLASCANMTMKYHSRIKTADGKEADFDYQKTYKTTGLAWTCGFTAIFYGGACWLYLSKPNTEESARVRDDAQYEMKQLGIQYTVEYDRITRKSWDAEDKRQDLAFVGSPMRSVASEPQEPISKRDFPDGWPEQWYYERDGYRYWTIVGDRSPTSTDSIVSSKKRADEVMKAEGISQYDTTANELRNVDGKVESWRIIRVIQKQAEE